MSCPPQNLLQLKAKVRSHDFLTLTLNTANGANLSNPSLAFPSFAAFSALRKKGNRCLRNAP